MRPRTYRLIVLCLLVALLGQCAGTPDQPPTPPADTVTAAASCDPRGVAS